MANNRIYLKCNVCGDTLFLGKSFLNGYYWTDYGALNGKDPYPLQERLNRFYDDHTYCRDSHIDGDFSIEYEIPEAFWSKGGVCSACGYHSGEIRTPYCPLCGRQMDIMDIMVIKRANIKEGK